MSYILNPLKRFIGDYLVDYSRGYFKHVRSLEYSLLFFNHVTRGFRASGLGFLAELVIFGRQRPEFSIGVFKTHGSPAYIRLVGETRKFTTAIFFGSRLIKSRMCALDFNLGRIVLIYSPSGTRFRLDLY